MLYLVLAIFALHIISFPLVISVTVAVNSDDNTGRIKVKLFFITVFKKKIDVEHIKRKINRAINKSEEESEEEEQSKNEGKKPTDKSGFNKFLIEVAKRVVTRIRVRGSDLQLRLGTGDAAVSAVTVGLLRVAYSQACAVLGYDGGYAELVPDYNSECIYVDFWGIFSLCIADIIYAVCAAVIKSITSGIHKRRNYANTASK